MISCKSTFNTIILSIILICSISIDHGIALGECNNSTASPQCVASNSPIDQKYQNMGGPSSLLGEPTGAETIAPDGVGHFRYFRGGVIYWSPQTGAHEIHGSILNKWAQLNWEKGPLGYPTSDVIRISNGVGNYFQHGYIVSTLTGTTVHIYQNEGKSGCPSPSPPGCIGE